MILLSPLELTLTKKAPVSPLESTLTEQRYFKPHRIILLQKEWRGGVNIGKSKKEEGTRILNLDTDILKLGTNR